MSQENIPDQTETSVAVNEVHRNFVRHFTELGMKPSKLSSEYIEELKTEFVLKNEGVAFAAHNGPVDDDQIKLINDAAHRLETTSTEVSSYLDQNMIATIIINPKIN